MPSLQLGFKTLPLELTIKSPFLKFLCLGWVARSPWEGGPIQRVESYTRDSIRAPSPHSPAEETEKESALPEVTQHAGGSLFQPHPPWACERVERLSSLNGPQ